MVSNIAKLEAFAKASQEVLNTVQRDIEAAKKEMTPEQRALFDKEMEGHDINGAQKDLNNALLRYKEVLKNL